MSEIGQAARKLLARRPGDDDSEQIAQRACEAFERLVAHLSRLLGEAGVQMLLQRSVVIASAQFPWLQTASAAGRQPGTPCSALCHAMEQQEPGSITDAFAEVFSAFVGLLKRLIGDGLVDRLLNEVWPAVFVPAVKDIP